MKNETRIAVLGALSELDKAKDALMRTLDQVDRHNIRNGLNRAMDDLKDASTELDSFINRPGQVAEQLRLARVDIDKTILMLEPHRKWFNVHGDSEERR